MRIYIYIHIISFNLYAIGFVAVNIFTSPKSQLTSAMKSFKTPDLGISSPNLGDIDLADDEGPALEIF